MDIGNKIKQRRLHLGLTLEQVAKEVGVEKSTVKKWEDGFISNMKRDKISSLASVLKINPLELIMDDVQDVTPVALTGMVPVLGSIPAGVPAFADELVEEYIPTMVRNPEEYFYLRVNGDSMINAGIPNGSKVLIHKQSTADPGQIVACRVNGDEATLKRFTQHGDTIILMPDNPAYSPIVVNVSEFENGYAEILGVAKQVTTELL